jgi:hypothetical protein
LVEQQSVGYANGIFSVNFLDVFANQSYNIINSFNGYTVGLKISIDDQLDIPLLNFNIISTRPGSCTYIKLTKTITRNLPFPYTSCKDLTNYHSELYDKFIKLNKTYSQKMCFQACMQEKVINTCNCSNFFFPNLDNYPTCQTFDQAKCAFSLASVDSDGCEAFCPLECESLSYDYTISSDIYPDETNFMLLKADPRTAALFQNANVNLANASFDALSNSVACVYIYYEDFRTTTIEQSRAMTEVILYFYKFPSLS